MELNDWKVEVICSSETFFHGKLTSEPSVIEFSTMKNFYQAKWIHPFNVEKGRPWMSITFGFSHFQLSIFKDFSCKTRWICEKMHPPKKLSSYFYNSKSFNAQSCFCLLRVITLFPLPFPFFRKKSFLGDKWKNSRERWRKAELPIEKWIVLTFDYLYFFKVKKEGYRRISGWLGNQIFTRFDAFEERRWWDESGRIDLC